MLAEIKLNRLNGATRECLERCYQSGSWLATLAEYAEHLRADGWTRAEIEEVETTVWRILRAVAQSDSFHAGDIQSTSPRQPLTQNMDLASA